VESQGRFLCDLLTLRCEMSVVCTPSRNEQGEWRDSITSPRPVEVLKAEIVLDRCRRSSEGTWIAADARRCREMRVRRRKEPVAAPPSRECSSARLRDNRSACGVSRDFRPVSENRHAHWKAGLSAAAQEIAWTLYILMRGGISETVSSIHSVVAPLAVTSAAVCHSAKTLSQYNTR